eukprot:6614808-Alexandrium_andersonii.AAC.1
MAALRPACSVLEQFPTRSHPALPGWAPDPARKCVRPRREAFWGAREDESPPGRAGWGRAGSRSKALKMGCRTA